MRMEQKKLEKRLFGTNGVRGVVGKDMTPALALSIGMALGTMRQGTIAVGRDTRTSGPSLASALKAGLLAAGCDVVDLGILPTPALQFIVREHFDAGAVITASHNPPNTTGLRWLNLTAPRWATSRVLFLKATSSRETPILHPGIVSEGSGMPPPWLTNM